MDQSFRIGSVTKTFVSTAVLLLVDDGKVDLDAPVARYVGDLTAKLPHGRTATVRHLLGMTSGFPDYTNLPTGPFGRLVLHSKKVWTPAELVAAARKERSTPPGTVSYSNTNYIVLGELIRRVTHRPMDRFISARILKPLGPTHTVIPSPGTTAKPSTHGYLNARWAEYARATRSRASTSPPASRPGCRNRRRRPPHRPRHQEPRRPRTATSTATRGRQQRRHPGRGHRPRPDRQHRRRDRLRRRRRRNGRT